MRRSNLNLVSATSSSNPSTASFRRSLSVKSDAGSFQPKPHSSTSTSSRERRQDPVPNQSPQLSFLYPPSCFNPSPTSTRFYSTGTQSDLGHTNVGQRSFPEQIDLASSSAGASSLRSHSSSSDPSSSSTSTLDSANSNESQSHGSQDGIRTEEDQMLESVWKEGDNDFTFQKVKQYLEGKTSSLIDRPIDFETEARDAKLQSGDIKGKGKESQSILAGSLGVIPNQEEILSYIEALEPHQQGSKSRFNDTNSSHSNGNPTSISVQTEGFQNLFLPFIKAYYSQNLFYQAGKILVFLLIGLEQFKRNCVKEIIESNNMKGKGSELNDGNSFDDDGMNGKGKGKGKENKEIRKESMNSVDLIKEETQVLIPDLLRDLIKESNSRIQSYPSDFNNTSTTTKVFDPKLATEILNSSFSLNWNWSISRNSIETSKILIEVIRDCFRNLELENGLKLFKVVLKGLWEVEQKVELMGKTFDRKDSLNDKTVNPMKSEMTKSGSQEETKNQESMELRNLKITLDFLKRSTKNLIENFKFNLKFNLRSYETIIKGENGFDQGRSSTPVKITNEFLSQTQELNPQTISLMSRKSQEDIKKEYSRSVMLLSELISENYYPLAPTSIEDVPSENESFELTGTVTIEDLTPKARENSVPSSNASLNLNKPNLSKQEKGEDINWILKRCFKINELIHSSVSDLESLTLLKEIKRNVNDFARSNLPIGYLNANIEKGIKRIHQDSVSKKPSSDSLQLFRQIRSKHLDQFSYNSLSNHLLNQKVSKGQLGGRKREHNLGLKVLKHMVDLKKFKEEDRKSELKSLEMVEKTIEDNSAQKKDLEIDQVTLNIVNRSNRLSRRRNKSSLNPDLLSRKEEQRESIQFKPTLKERKNIKSLTRRSELIKILDKEIEKEDVYSINELLMDFLVTTSGGKEKWWPSATTSGIGKSSNEGSVISVRHLIYHLYPELNLRRSRSRSRSNLEKVKKRKQFLSNPILLTTSLNLAVKNGKTGLAMSLWSLIKNESFNSFEQDQVKGWHIPLEAATLFFQSCQNEAKKGLDRKLFLPKYQTSTTNFKHFNKYLEEPISNIPEDEENASYFNGRFRANNNLKVRNQLRKQVRQVARHRMNLKYSGVWGVRGRYLKGGFRRIWAKRMGPLGKRGKIYMAGRRSKSPIKTKNKVDNSRRKNGWLRGSEPRIRRRDVALENARRHYLDLMQQWGYHSTSNHSLEVPQNVEVSTHSQSGKYTSASGTSSDPASRDARSKSRPPQVDAKLFNSLLEVFGRADGMLTRGPSKPSRESVMKKLRTEISFWEVNEVAQAAHLESFSEEQRNITSTSNLSANLSSIDEQLTTQIFLTQGNAHRLLSKSRPPDQTLFVVLKDFFHLGFRIPLGYLQFLPYSLGLEGKEARMILEEMLREEEKFEEQTKKSGKRRVRFDLYRLEEGKRRSKGMA